MALNLMRFRNILQPTVQGNKFLSGPSINDESTFNPEHVAIDRFNSLLEKEPQYKRPGFLRTLLGGGIAALTGGGPSEARAIIDAPYNQEMADWKSRLEPAFQAANLERQSNIAGQNRMFTEREAIRKEKADERRFETDQARLEETARRNEDLQRQFNDRELRLQEQFKQGAINQQELEKLRAENAKMRQDAQIAANAELESKRQTGRETIEEMQARHATELEGKRQAGRVFGSQLPKPTTPETELDKGRKVQNKFKELSDSGKYNKYIVKDPNTNEYGIDPSTPDPIRQEILKQVYGSSGSTPSVKPKPDPLGIRGGV